MGILAAFLPNPRCLARLESAVGTLHEVRNSASWQALDSACLQSPVDVAVVDLYGEGPANFDAIRRIRGQFETITLIAYVSFAPERSRDLFDLGRAGVAGLLLTDLDDSPRTIRAIVERAEARGPAAELRRGISGQSIIVRDAVMVAVTRAHEHLTGDRLADICGTSRRTLCAELHAAGFPAPARLITWGRLIVGGQMLRDRRRSADAVARALDFPSGSAFRNTCQRYLGLKPTELREAGYASAVITRLFAAVQHRSRG